MGATDYAAKGRDGPAGAAVPGDARRMPRECSANCRGRKKTAGTRFFRLTLFSMKSTMASLVGTNGDTSETGNRFHRNGKSFRGTADGRSNGPGSSEPRLDRILTHHGPVRPVGHRALGRRGRIRGGRGFQP